MRILIRRVGCDPGFGYDPILREWWILWWRFSLMVA